MPANAAAWLKIRKAETLVVESAPYTSPKQDEVVIKNHAVAINPIDWILKDVGDTAFGWLKYPFIFGTDVAGEVVEVGSNVTRFRAGDRIVGQAVGSDEKQNTSAKGGFQSYTVLLADIASPIPDRMSFENAAVLPLGLSTAACGLFQKDQLALQHPTVPRSPSTGKTLLVWGGSTSVGCNAIQLAVAAGYEVITTCSPKNFNYVKTLGASQTFDYNCKTIIADLTHALRGKTTAGALVAGQGGLEACMDILHKSNGNKFISLASVISPQLMPESFVIPRLALTLGPMMAGNWLKSKMRGIRTNFIFGTTLVYNEVGKAVWMDFLPKALAEGSYIAAPDAEVVGEGLDAIQEALNVQKKGVSAKKIVVPL